MNGNAINTSISDNEDENNKNDIIFENMCHLLKNAHRLVKVSANSKDVEYVIRNYNRQDAVSLIEQNIVKYKNILDALSKINGRYIVCQPDFYKDKSDEIILCDLKYIRNVIYFDEIKNASLEFVLEKLLKKLKII